MADRKKKNFPSMADEELRKELEGLSKALHGLRTQTVTSTVENKSLFRSNRRDIARILTEIRARELKAPKPASQPAPAPAAKPSSVKAKGGKTSSPSAKATGDKSAKKAPASKP